MAKRTERSKTIPVRIDVKELRRVDAIAKAVDRPRGTLLRNIITDAIFSSDAEQVLSGSGGSKWR